MNRWFVTATDTGVGKTEVAVALLRNLVRAGEKPFGFKPFESGSGDDGERLRVAAGAWQALHEVTVHRFRAPLAPAMAARKDGKTVSWTKVIRQFGRLGAGPGVVEGAGGLYVPLDDRHDVIDLIEAVGAPVVVVARAGLGTVNHTTLTLGALEARGLPVRAIVLNRASQAPDPSVPLNRAELERRFPRVPVIGPVPFSRNEARRQRVLQAMLGDAGL